MKFIYFLILSAALHSLVFIGSIKDRALKIEPRLLVSIKKYRAASKENLKKKPNTNKTKAHKNAENKSSYSQELIAYIQSQATYPKTALARQQEGTVVLSLLLDTQGDIISYKVTHPSKHNSLTLAAVSLAKNLKAYRPLPKNLHPTADFIVPINYILN